MKKIKKGSFGYMAAERKRSILRTVLFFGISLLVFLTGYFSTGSSKNLLSVVAVLGCLPASKSAVNMIMFLKYKGCSEAVKEELAPHEGDLLCLYDLVLTSYDKNFQISHLAIRGSVVAAYTEDPKSEDNAFSRHLTSLFAKDSHKGVTFKLFHDPAKYRNRLEQMQQLEPEGEKEEVYARLILAVSL